jgi:hypothetical protein
MNESFSSFPSRPLHELLPIARKYLTTAASKYPHDTSVFTCIAAFIASDIGEMSRVEVNLLVTAIGDALWYEGYKHSTLYSKLLEMGMFDDGEIGDAASFAFFPIRDKWLDELQEKFLAMNPMEYGS